jgi:hypothetical protein
MADSLSAQANKQAIDAVKRDKPSSFVVGGSVDVTGKRADGGVSYNRRIWNGWGATAYLRAWWDDAAVIPRDKFGAVIGGELEKKF